MWTNQHLSWARAVEDMVILAQAMIDGGALRKESRGSHYRTDFPERDDANFMRTTVAKWNPAAGKVLRGPAPLSLALAHGQVDNDQVLLSPWSETDFRDGSQPWWA